MSFASEYELHRPFGIVPHGSQALDVGENQVGSLVGGKAAGKSDGQSVWTQYLTQSLQDLSWFEATLGLFHGSAAHKLEQLRFQAKVRLPKFAVIHILNAFPGARVAAALVPVRSQMPIIEAKHLRSQPGRNMNSVSDVSNGNLVFRLPRTEPGPHRSGYLAVQGGNCIDTARKSQTQHRHTESLLLVVW